MGKTPPKRRHYIHPFLDTFLPFIRWVKGKLTRIDSYFSTRPRARKWTIIITVILGPIYNLLVGLFILVWFVTPSTTELRYIQNQNASEIYSADSVLLGRYFIQDRTEIKYEEIAPSVIHALIATEDVRFYEHTGVDFISLGRVLVKSIFLQDESAGGGSTITQQLAKNLFPRKRYWLLSMLTNKLREGITARRLEDIYSKEDLITLYLNTVPFADNVYGIQAAAQRFYSTTAQELNSEQAAVLIGMLKATHYYNPRLFPDRAQERRNVVLAQMTKYNFLPDTLVDSLKTLPLTLVYNRVSHHHGLAPYFREQIKKDLTTWCNEHKKEDGSPYNIYTDGLKIYTTLDSKLQVYAENAVIQQMTEVQRLFFDHWGNDKPWKGKENVLEEAIQRSSRYQNLKQQDLSEEEIMQVLQKPLPMKIFTWQGEQEILMSPIDSIIHHLQYLNAGFVAIEPSTGQVKAWVGGIAHDFFQYDHVKTTTKRQVGSIFKPIVYAMAIEQGTHPCQLISAGRETYIDDEGEKWTPRNMQNDYEVEYTLRGALAYSINTVSVKLIQQAGVNNTIALARKMGITSEIPDVPSIALGSSSISLMEMTTAYACIANEGVKQEPYYIASIADSQGEILEEFKPSDGVQAISKETVQLVRHMMQTVVREGTAGRLRWQYGIYNDVAGKTGTTQSNADGWFMAITPELAIGTWVGADDPRIRFRFTNLGQGSSTALPMVAYFMKQVNENPLYQSIAKAKFESLDRSLQEKLDCDLYELSADLWDKIEKTIVERDSTIRADTLAEPPKETFLQMLYWRKRRLMEAQYMRDSLDLIRREDIGG